MTRTTNYMIGLAAVVALSSGAFAGTALTNDHANQTAQDQHSEHTELAQSSRARGRHRGLRQARFSPRRGRVGERILRRFDTDKDGKLTQAEVDKARAEQHAKFDTNKDGRLNLREYEALWLSVMRKRMVDAFQRHDDDGNAAITVKEFQERFKNLVARADFDDNGVFSRDDIRQRLRQHRRVRGRSGKRKF